MDERFDVIVVGGGPGGSAVAAIAARKGLRVLLLEADRHPRTHVGESLLPGIVPILDQMGALQDVENAGFTRKTGSTHWNWGLTPEWDLWFTDTEEYDHAWLVERARFDEILFRAAERAGAVAFERSPVQEFLWEGDRLVGVAWRRRGEQEIRKSFARFVVDASGQAALLSRELNLRSMIPGLQHHSSWAHFEHAGRLPPPRTAQALLVAAQRHWIWYFALDEKRTSVGVVFQEDYKDLPEEERARTFDELVQSHQGIRELLGPNAKRISQVHSQRDWSYRMSTVVGPGWLLVGDASGFVDPILSTGVFLAMRGAEAATRAMVRVIQGGVPEADAMAEYNRANTELLNDIVRMVKFFYQRTLPNTDYFWESKRILDQLPNTDLKPQKAFLALTSGLVRNLALDDYRSAAFEQRASAAERGRPQDDHAPEKLGFLCARLAWNIHGVEQPVFLLIEPTDPSAPSYARTRRWDVNCLTPRYRQALSVDGAFAKQIRGFVQKVRELDTADEPLAAFWQRTRPELVSALRGLGPSIELRGVFGE